MSILNSIFDGLFGYEKLMLICSFILFVFALAAITLMIVQRRDFKAAVLLIVVAIVLMGFPGIQAVKFSKGMVELDRIRAQPIAPTDPARKQQDQRTLSDLQQRAGDNPQLLARVSDGYRAIGDVNKAYDLASSVLQDKPSVAVQRTLIPVLTAKLNQVQAAAPSPPPADHTVTAASSASANPTPVTVVPAPAASGTVVATVPASAVPDSAKQREISALAKQLQAVAAAIGELKAGACEAGGNNCGPFVRKYLAPAGVAEGNSWCASFVSWCCLQAVGGDRTVMPFAYSPGARSLLAEFKQNGWSSAPGSGYQPLPGDIVVWWRVSLQGWLGHVGLVHSVQDGMLYTIEGNRSPRVQGFSYVLSRLDKLLGFGHVP